MASTNSTEHLQLNQWSGTDRPKMADFNADNQKIDGALHAHTADGAAHVSAQERAAWTGAVPVLGSYEGDGQPMQEISLGFSPAFGIVFAAGENPFQPVDQTTVALRAAFLAGGGSSQAALVTETGFSVLSSATPSPDGSPPSTRRASPINIWSFAKKEGRRGAPPLFFAGKISCGVLHFFKKDAIITCTV